MLFLRRERVPLHRARPSRPWPIEPDLGRERHGYLRRRLDGAGRRARSEERDPRRPLDRRRRSGPLHRPARRGRAVAKAVLIGAVPPLMLKTAANPGGLPMDVFDGFRAAPAADRSQLYLDIATDRSRLQSAGREGLAGTDRKWWLQGMMGGHKNTYDCIKAFSETDFTEDLKKFDVPTLIIHGDDDQIVPIGAAAMLRPNSSRARSSKSIRPLARPGATHHEVGQSRTARILQGVSDCRTETGAARESPGPLNLVEEIAMRIVFDSLAAVAACTLLVTVTSAQSARDVRGQSPLVAIENEPPPRLIVDPPWPNNWPAASCSSSTGRRTCARYRCLAKALSTCRRESATSTSRWMTRRGTSWTPAARR